MAKVSNVLHSQEAAVYFYSLINPVLLGAPNH
jgi:hypothetical protein